MSCGAGIYTVNTGATITDGGTIPLGTTVRRWGQHCVQAGDGIVCKGNGYYNISGVVALTAAAVGTPTLTVLNNGTAVAGGAFSVSVAAASSTVLIPFNCEIRNTCGNSSTITLQIVDGSGTGNINMHVVQELSECSCNC